MTMSDMHRREFIKRTSAAGLGVLAASPGLAPLIRGKARSPGETVRVAIIGVNGRGGVHAKNFAMLPNSEVAYICDVDSRLVHKGVDNTKSQTRAPKTVSEFPR